MLCTRSTNALVCRALHGLSTQEALIRTGILAGHQRWCTDPLRHSACPAWRSTVPVRVLHHSATRWSSIEPKKEESKNLTTKERLGQLWNTVKYLFRFYLDGVKQIWRNRAEVKAIQRHVRETKRDYTWEETQMIRTHSSDMLKLPLFLLILVTVEELLPLMVIYTPFLLPSTCILPSQALKIRQRLEVNRETAVQKIQNLLREHKDIQPQSDSLPDALAALPPASLRELTVYVSMLMSVYTTCPSGERMASVASVFWTMCASCRRMISGSLSPRYCEMET